MIWVIILESALSIIIEDNKLRKLCRRYKLLIMVLFGSAVKGTANAESDIDIGIITSEKVTTQYELELIKAVSTVFRSGKIDLVILNRADPLICFSVATEGRLLYEKKPGTFNEFKVRSFKLHADAAKFYQLDKDYVTNFIRKKAHG